MKLIIERSSSLISDEWKNKSSDDDYLATRRSNQFTLEQRLQIYLNQ